MRIETMKADTMRRDGKVSSSASAVRLRRKAKEYGEQHQAGDVLKSLTPLSGRADERPHPSALAGVARLAADRRNRVTN
jgi:hypothetical protein